MNFKASILLVDDDHRLTESMADWLREMGYDTDTAEDLDSASRAIRTREYDLLITDLRLGADDGFDVLKQTLAVSPETTVLVVTGYATPDTAIEAVRAGAFDLLTKPLIDEELTLAIERALEQRNVTPRERRTAT